MQWYYAEQGRQMGPLDEAGLDELVTAGIVRDDTLVWRDGMAQWSTHASVRGPRNAAPMPASPAPSSQYGMTQICGECGKAFGLGELVPIGPAYICAVCKPIYLQRIREGGGQALGSLRYAGFWIRFVARMIDGVLLLIVRFALLLPLGVTVVAPPSGGNPVQAMTAAIRITAISNLVALALAVAYEVFFLTRYGATIGKMMLGLKVVRADGTKLTTGVAVGRYFAMLVSEFTIFIGFIIAAFDDQKRALHDRMCDTRVVYANESVTQLALNRPQAPTERT